MSEQNFVRPSSQRIEPSSPSVPASVADHPKGIVAAVAYLTNYMATYDQQFGYADYSEQTYIDDVLYGLGASLGDQYRWAGGFDAFKKRLMAHLKEGAL